MKWFQDLKVRNKLLIAFVFTLVIAVGVNIFSLTLLINNEAAYSDAIDETEHQFSCVFDVLDKYSRARMIIREIQRPNITVEDLDALYNEMDSVLGAAAEDLNYLVSVTTGNIKAKSEEIRPMIEQYRTDAKGSIDLVRKVGFVDPDDEVYRDATLVAQLETERMSREYANRLNSDITSLSDLALAELKNTSTVLSAAAAQARTTMIIILVIISIIIMAVAWYIPSLISKPLITLTTFMNKACTTGDIAFTQDESAVIDKYSNYKDEISQLIGATAEFVNEINLEMDMLEELAGGNLTINPRVLSENGKIGKSLSLVVNNLNDMFGEINGISAQVSRGAKQVAETSSSIATGASQMSEGAQSLAEGAMKQSEYINELSNTVTDIAEKTKANTEMAGLAAQLADTIIAKAEKGQPNG